MNKNIKKTFVTQHDRSDCGVACLASIVRYHGGDVSLERLRDLSGTTQQGTTLLGLYQAAKELGLDAEGLQAETVENLSEVTSPVILNVVIDKRLQHYFVFYGFDKHGRAIIGDPAEGIVLYSKEDLEKVWRSKSLLTLAPNSEFTNREHDGTRKQQWLMQLVKDDLNILVVALCSGIFISLLGLSLAVFSQKLIDDIIPSANREKLIFSVIIVTVLLLGRTLLAYIRATLLIHQAVDFNKRVIQEFFKNIVRLPKRFFDTRKTGELIARMNDTRRIQSAISTLVGNILIDVLIVLTSLVAIHFYSVTIGIICLCSIPAYVILLFVFNQRIIKSQRAVMTHYAQTESHFIDTIQGIAAIKAANKEDFFQSVNNRVFAGFQTALQHVGIINLRFGVFSELTGILLTSAVIGVASFMVLEKDLQSGEMIALLSISASIVPSINRLVVSNLQLQEARIAFARMFEFTSIAPEPDPAPDDKKVDAFEIRIENLTFRFPGRSPILKNVNLHVKRNEMIVLLGENGSGKSTLMQILQKFYPYEQGSIIIDSADLNSISTTAWRNMTGAVSQDVKIFNGNVLFNITLSDKQEDHAAAIEFCQRNGLATYFDSFPQGFLTLLGEGGVNISGGQRQLVALARALFKKPRLLLMDEGTSAMDKKTEAFVMNLLRSLKSKIALIFVTHRVSVASEADRIYVLHGGEIKELAKLEALADIEGVI